MKKKQLAAMALVAVMLTGCGGGSAAPDATKAADGGTVTTAADAGGKEGGSQKAASGEAVTIILVESFTSPERTAVLREIMDKYQAEHSNITIDITSPPLGDVDAKIIQVPTNGNGTDIVEVRDSTVTQYTTNEWIADLQKYIDVWDEEDILTESADEIVHYLKGGAYPIPYGFHQRGPSYHPDWSEEKGLDQPETWRDIYDAGLAIIDPANSRFDYSFRGDPSGYQYADTVYRSWVGADKVADPNAVYFLKDGDGATIFTLPKVREALYSYKDLFKNTRLTDSIAWGFSEMVQGFVGGTTAMLIQDPEVTATCFTDMQDDQRALVPFPKGLSDQAIFPNGFVGWGMTSFTEHPDETADSLLYLFSSENNTYLVKNYPAIPIHNNVAERDTYFSEGRFAMYMDMAKEPDVYHHAAYSQMYQALATYKTRVDIMYQKYLTGEITDDELLQWLDEFWAQTHKDEGRKQ